jgi:S1-C subfamily serine protease
MNRKLSSTRRLVWALVAVLAATAAGSIAYAGTLTASSASSATLASATRVTPPAGAIALQNAYQRVVKAVAPSVVQIETGDGLGSGIVLDAKGDIVTNAHVVGDATNFTVTFANGKRAQASLVGTFRAGDLAVIKVSNPPQLRPASFANSGKLQVGQIAIAIGNPLGFRSSVTQGIVSALNRTVPEGNGVALPNVIQTSAPINPGNSGGALVDLFGRVIGIPTLGASDPQLGGAANGIGFAIPSNTVRDIANQLVSSGKVTNSNRAYLGIQIGETLGGNGVYVGAVTSGGPAAKAGLRAVDVITAVASKSTPDADALASVLANLRPGQTVKVTVSRQSGGSTTVDVTLGTFPGS